MDLREQQDVLARLITGASAGGTRIERMPTLYDVDPLQLEMFSESLFRKRLHEVAKLLPLVG